MTKLFISYRSLDSAKVDTIAARLRSLKHPDGSPRYQVWQDKTSSPPGKDWWQAIVEAIIDCEIFLFMVSRESVQNINCRAELSYARKRNRPLIPLVLESEFSYNPVSGRNDIDYWDQIPAELIEARSQFLFYEGTSFVNQLEGAITVLLRQGPRDIPAPWPPDPRNTDDVTNDTALIYDRACDYAGRLEFATAEKLFQRLLNWGDLLFAEDAHAWMILLRDYQQMVRLDERASARYKIPQLWLTYAAQFPKPFTPLFDPKGFQSRYGAKRDESPPASPSVPAPSHPVGLARIPTTPAEAVLDTRWSDSVRGHRPSSLDLLPAPFAWVEIPGSIGRTWKGAPFAIARYPVTNAQFRLFIDAGAYTEREWWTETGWEVRAEQGWTQPRYWTDSTWNGPEHPVVGVSWYEAVAFCLWLSHTTGEKIMLPAEDQWQYAAQGDDGRDYPWGPQWTGRRCNNNVDGKGIGKTTPVRQYEGKWDRPFGVVDMAGNVWEWCLTDYENRTNDVNSAADRRVLRGGSWFDFDTVFFRCDYRDRDDPTLRDSFRGFRVSRS